MTETSRPRRRSSESPKLPIAIVLTDLLFGIVAFAIVGVLTKDGRLIAALEPRISWTWRLTSGG